MSFKSFVIFAQERPDSQKCSGKVIDELEMPVPYAIIIFDSNFEEPIHTDAFGNFQFVDSIKTETLLVYAEGYETRSFNFVQDTVCKVKVKLLFSELVHEIPEVEVSAQNINVKGILNSVIKEFDNNYGNSPYMIDYVHSRKYLQNGHFFIHDYWSLSKVLIPENVFKHPSKIQSELKSIHILKNLEGKIQDIHMHEHLIQLSFDVLGFVKELKDSKHYNLAVEKYSNSQNLKQLKITFKPKEGIPLKNPQMKFEGFLQINLNDYSISEYSKRLVLPEENSFYGYTSRGFRNNKYKSAYWVRKDVHVVFQINSNFYYVEKAELDHQVNILINSGDLNYEESWYANSLLTATSKPKFDLELILPQENVLTIENYSDYQNKTFWKSYFQKSLLESLR